jgi:CheY-like chemotaxis protein
MKQGPIIIAEDDFDDQEILKETLEDISLKNKLIFFDNGNDVLDYLRTTKDQPFLIISDVNLLKMNGLELRRQINQDEVLRKKSIPFIFLTTSANQVAVDEAYDMMVQGFFQKEHNYKKVGEMIRMIIDYWRICKHPNSF